MNLGKNFSQIFLYERSYKYLDERESENRKKNG